MELCGKFFITYLFTVLLNCFTVRVVRLSGSVLYIDSDLCRKELSVWWDVELYMVWCFFICLELWDGGCCCNKLYSDCGVFNITILCISFRLVVIIMWWIVLS